MISCFKIIFILFNLDDSFSPSALILKPEQMGKESPKLASDGCFERVKS